MQQVIIFHLSLLHSLPIVPIFYHINATLPLHRLFEACLPVNLPLVSYLAVFSLFLPWVSLMHSIRHLGRTASLKSKVNVYVCVCACAHLKQWDMYRYGCNCVCVKTFQLFHNSYVSFVLFSGMFNKS